MKKILLLVLVCLLVSSSVLGYSAVRSISGNEVTLNIDPSGGSGVYTVQEKLVGASVSGTSPKGCGASNAGKVLTCDFDSTDKGTIVYQTTGSGTVSGVITDEKDVAITGDSSIPKPVTPPGPVCGNGLVEKGEECDGNAFSVAKTCPADSPNPSAKVNCYTPGAGGCKFDLSACSAKASCQNSCPVDQKGIKSCDALGKVQECKDTNNDGCVEWSSTACLTGQVCQSGVCKDVSCPKGYKCDDPKAEYTGKLNEVVCGTDLNQYQCGNTGSWAPTGKTCVCSNLASVGADKLGDEICAHVKSKKGTKIKDLDGGFFSTLAKKMSTYFS